MFGPFVHVNQRFILITSYAGFQNIMACRVFRGVALGMIQTDNSCGLNSTEIAVAIQLEPLPLSRHATLETSEVEQ